MADQNKRWTINLQFEIDAPSQQAAEQEANRLGTQVAEKFNLDEMNHTVGQSTGTYQKNDPVGSGSSKSGSGGSSS